MRRLIAVSALSFLAFVEVHVRLTFASQEVGRRQAGDSSTNDTHVRIDTFVQHRYGRVLRCRGPQRYPFFIKRKTFRDESNHPSPASLVRHRVSSSPHNDSPPPPT